MVFMESEARACPHHILETLYSILDVLLKHLLTVLKRSIDDYLIIRLIDCSIRVADCSIRVF